MEISQSAKNVASTLYSNCKLKGMSDAITEFKDGNFFLSNFFVRDVTYQRFVFPSSENAYQAAKTHKAHWWLFLEITPSQSKRLGKEVELNPDWEETKVQIMYDILKIKFAYPDLRAKLLETGDKLLVEGNYWHDTFWGVCNGKGTNVLGHLLMKLRNEIRLENKFS